MYFYEDYVVEENEKSYVVTGDFNEDFPEIRIEKNDIEKIQIGEEPEKIAILIATIEFIRFDTSKCNKRKEKMLQEQENLLMDLK